MHTCACAEWYSARAESVYIRSAKTYLRRDRSVDSTAHPRSEISRPVAGNRKVGIAGILEPNIQRTAGKRGDFLDPGDVHHGASVDAHKLLRIQLLLQVRD